MWNAPVRGTKVKVEGMSQEAVVHDYGMLFYGNDGKAVSTKISLSFFLEIGNIFIWISGWEGAKMITFTFVKLNIFI